MLWLVVTALATPWNVDDSGVVLGGWDPVSYHEGQPKQGDAAHALQWDGAVWHFASDANRKRFEAAPAETAPAFGGWCAFGFAMDPGATGWPVGPYPVDTKSYLVRDGRLLLFHDSSEFHARAQWTADADAPLARADAAWQQWSAGRKAVGPKAR
ncbi:MAG: YHS domain-containing protein [Myxococcota bacterium]|jgi:YHS domain-containing protein